MSVLIPCIFTKPVFRIDKSVRLEFETREFDGLSAVALMQLRSHEGWLLFSANQEDVSEEQIPDEKADAMLGSKTQAQRIRGVLFKLWEQNGKQGSFDSYYKAKTEQIIDSLKEKIDNATD